MPWVSFLAGLGGSFHCVAMCGGLASASCNNKTDVFHYQFGRLAGYIILGLFAGFLGRIFSLQASNPKLSIIPGLLLGGLFLFWGIENLRGKKAEIPTPKFFSKIYANLWKKFVLNNKGISKSFVTGLLSIFLPCGMLYGIVIGVAAFDHSFKAIIAMFFFWLGTLPSMVLAPSILQKIMSPLKSKLPKTYALSLIFVGLVTISMRVVKFNDANAAASTTASKHHCH